ncbi:hypothetical protein D0871_23380 [Vibrio parahaemolyticus]|uniref:hypothetical protein n=1 Tax=Vibrio parahaemolyticus TaxID=670 RepID=UPI000EFC4847|nr:hypothetical protein [Vibrio parahaemolyticus]AYO07221.1 hypothetical protein D0871_23380 [Vibrio parahaemolyticus]
MFKKTCILVSMIALSSSVYASGFENQRSPSIEYGSLVVARTFQNLNGQVNIGIQAINDECKGFSSQPMPVPSLEVNGVMVKHYGQCMMEGIRMDFPATDKGIEYVKKEFLGRAKVIYKQGDFKATFDTSGHSDAAKEAENEGSGI